MSRTTRFVLLVHKNGWAAYEKFSIHFANAAQLAAERENAPELARVDVSRSSFDRWMGRKADALKGTPRGGPYRVLRHMFNMSVERLFEPVGAHALSAVPNPVTTVTVPTAQQLGFDDPLEVVAQARTLTGTNAEPLVLSMIATSIEGIVDRYEALGPQQLSGETRLLRKLVHSLLDGRQPPGARADLFGLASRAAGLLAYMAVNAGAAFEVVDAYCTEAESLAREIGDGDLEMWSFGTRSLGLYYQGRYPEADQAALAGISLAPESGQAIRLLINGRARALARLGDRRGTELAIGQALRLSDQQAALPDGLTSCISFAPYSMARSLANAVTARLSLGDTAEVLTYAGQINELVKLSDSEWSRALVGLDVATALLQGDPPEVEQAMALGSKALRSGTTAPIRSVWQRANELYERAGRWHDEPSVGEYAEELRTWRSRPQAEKVVVGSCASSAPDH
ncbi:hypothetical protein ACIQVO_37340 [Streptomyces sp. NPDC101062]|uniref:hypothetical protein n=1 Tax=unclassified Streptomyces TaxID=2593676 RepID=UPI003813441D